MRTIMAEVLPSCVDSVYDTLLKSRVGGNSIITIRLMASSSGQCQCCNPQEVKKGSMVGIDGKVYGDLWVRNISKEITSGSHREFRIAKEQA